MILGNVHTCTVAGAAAHENANIAQILYTFVLHHWNSTVEGNQKIA